MPDGAVPAVLNGVPMAPWSPPSAPGAWEALAAGMTLTEPAFVAPAGLAPAAGAVVLKPDGRARCVAPTNKFGGHEYTLPKGRLDGRSAKAAALVEVFEEAGLRIRLDSFLVDVLRSITFTRFYVATRTGGTPAACGWEVQACVLAPVSELRTMLTHPGDQLVLDALVALRLQ